MGGGNANSSVVATGTDVFGNALPLTSSNCLTDITVTGENVSWTGGSGGKLAGLADYPFVVPSSVTARIQECHITLGHVLCELVEESLLGHAS